MPTTRSNRSTALEAGDITSIIRQARGQNRNRRQYSQQNTEQQTTSDEQKENTQTTDDGAAILGVDRSENTPSMAQCITRLTALLESQHSQNSIQPPQNQYIRMLYETQNIVPFTTPFISTNKDTLTYILAIQQHLMTHAISDPLIKFRTIFSTIPKVYQDQFMIDAKQTAVQNNKQPGDYYTIEHFQKWIQAKFPPPHTRKELLTKLHKMIYKYNEHPTAVFTKFTTKLNKIEQCIEIINAGIPNIANQIPKITDREKYEALLDVFFHRNNQKHFKNTGAINGKVHKCIDRNDPPNYAELVRVINNKLPAYTMPKVRADDPKYQYKIYASTPGEDSLYFTRNKSNNHNNDNNSEVINKNNKNNGKFNKKRRKRPYNNDKEQNGNKQKRSKQSCYRCGRPGHIVGNCIAKRHKNGQMLENVETCTRCGYNGHNRNECYAKTHKKGFTLNSNNNNNKQNNNNKNKNYQKNNYKQNQNNNNYPKYNPTNNPQNKQAMRELSQHQKNRHKQRKEMFNIQGPAPPQILAQRQEEILRELQMIQQQQTSLLQQQQNNCPRQ